MQVWKCGLGFVLGYNCVRENIFTFSEKGIIFAKK